MTFCKKIMDLSLKNSCDLFLENKHNCRGSYSIHIGATDLDCFISYMFTLHDQKMDHDVMMEQYRYLYRKEMEQAYRGSESIALMCHMAMSKDSEAFFKQVESVFELFPIGVFSSCPVGVGTMIEDCRPNDAKRIVDRTIELYNRLKKAYSNDISNYHLSKIATLALTDRSVDDIFEDFKTICKLKNISTNRLILMLNKSFDEGQTIELFEKVDQIHKLIKKKKHPIVYPAFVDLLAQRPESVESIVELYVEVDDYLKQDKDFRGLFKGSEYRRMVAALLVHKYLMDQDRGNSELSLEEKILYHNTILMAQDAVFTSSVISNTGGDC